jgi:hypothetical protein
MMYFFRAYAENFVEFALTLKLTFALKESGLFSKQAHPSPKVGQTHFVGHVPPIFSIRSLPTRRVRRVMSSIPKSLPVWRCAKEKRQRIFQEHHLGLKTSVDQMRFVLTLLEIGLHHLHFPCKSSPLVVIRATINQRIGTGEIGGGGDF